jgi:hypothetical protein
LPFASRGTQIEAVQNDCPAVQRLLSQSASVWQKVVQMVGDVPAARQIMSPTQLSSALHGRPKYPG